MIEEIKNKKVIFENIQNSNKDFFVLKHKKIKTNIKKKKSVYNPQNPLNVYSLEFNKDLLKVYKSLFNIDISNIQNQLNKQFKFNYSKYVLNCLNNDLTNISKYKKLYFFGLEYKKDENKYNHIKKKQHLTDFSLLNMLKIAKSKNLISNQQYKNTIRRINNNKKPVNSVLSIISMLQKNIIHKENNKHYAKNENMNNESYKIKSVGLNYNIKLKKPTNKRINDLIYRQQNETITKINENINKEFNEKLKVNNTIVKPQITNIK